MRPSACPRRAVHATRLSRLLEAFGYKFVRCPCGLRYPALIDRAAN